LVQLGVKDGIKCFTCIKIASENRGCEHFSVGATASSLSLSLNAPASAAIQLAFLLLKNYNAMKIKYFEGYQGVRLAADVGGNPVNPAVVLLHGGGQTRHSWRRAARELVAADYHVISLDLRGHGESSWAENGDYSFDAYVNDLKIIIAALETAPALVGASLGGIISLLTAAELKSTEVSSVVLVDVVPRMEQSGIDAIRSFMMDNRSGFNSIEEAAETVARYLPHRQKPATHAGLGKNLRYSSDGRLYWHWDPVFLEQHDERNTTLRMEAAAKNFSLPTLLLRGEKSELVTESGVRALTDLIPHAQYREIGSAGHMVAGDNNDAFNEAIIAFISEHARCY